MCIDIKIITFETFIRYAKKYCKIFFENNFLCENVKLWYQTLRQMNLETYCVTFTLTVKVKIAHYSESI